MSSTDFIPIHLCLLPITEAVRGILLYYYINKKSLVSFLLLFITVTVS